ncbi:tryptophan-rich sensory protein [Patescibacteria group bacterium]|nr:tryptophan-rich sensory protein [Patescibacteria group bacterium]
MKNKNIFTYISFIIICQLAGIIGSLFTTPAIRGWYTGITKPSFNPPNWLFAPVWTTLFVLMGISVSMIWLSEKNELRKKALVIFFIQLVLNTLWSIIFFGMENPMLAFYEIIILWFAILYTIILFWKIKKPAAILLIPYILWVSFAAVLNLSIALLN